MAKREPYDRTFKQLKIGKTFYTSTGKWKVYDKGKQTIVAYKADKPINYIDLVVFEDFEFTQAFTAKEWKKFNKGNKKYERF